MVIATPSDTLGFPPRERRPSAYLPPKAVAWKGWAMEWMMALAVLSLFTDIKIAAPGFAYLRPFDVLAALMFAFAMARAKSWRDCRLTPGLLFLIPFFMCHALSAFTLDKVNGARETVQIGIIFAFALTLSMSIERLDYARLGRILLAGMTAITAYNIYWHVSHGFMTGWKRLNEPKGTFTFLPLVLAAELAFYAMQDRWKTWLYWAFFGAIILQSGERKALIVFGLLSVALISRGRALVAVLIVAAGVLGLSVVGATTTNPYMAQQVQSILDPFHYDSYTLSRPIDPEESITNAQRFFAADLSKQLIAAHPFFGVGTNGYINIVLARYAYLPDYFQLGIHGEFLRIPTENGFIGLFLYLLIWGASIVRTFATLMHYRRTGLIGVDLVIILPPIFFVPFLFFIGFEASGTHSMVVIALVSLLPDVLRSTLPRYLAKGSDAHAHVKNSAAPAMFKYPFVGAR